MASIIFIIRNGTLALFLALTCDSRTARAAEYTYVLRISGGQLPAGTRIIRVKQNDSVKLQWSADRRTVVHLHGYDIERTVTPGPVTEMTFSASMTGRFPIEVHGQGHENTLAYIEVMPE
jgi:hypothetical protein